MPSLKDMRVRINSVKQTRKITSAMKLVAASKLKRAQEQAESSRPFADRMSAAIASTTPPECSGALTAACPARAAA